MVMFSTWLGSPNIAYSALIPSAMSCLMPRLVPSSSTTPTTVTLIFGSSLWALAAAITIAAKGPFASTAPLP